jgi:DNA polymerase III alpha subunit
MLVKSFKLVKKEVPGFLKDKFGEHFAQISTDTTMKLRSSVKDVARVHMKSVPFEIEELTKKFINAPQGVDDPRHVFGYESGDGWVQGSIEYDAALREYIAKYPDQWKVTQSVLGLRKTQGRHASSFAIGNRPLQEYIPTVDIGGVRCTQYTAVSVEKSGAIKNDYLVVNSLNDISECVRLVQQGHNIPLSCTIKNKMVPRVRLLPYKEGLVDIWALPEDQKVFDEVASGRTETVFQFSTPGAIRWLEYFNKKRPDGSLILNSILQMAIFTALDRPGPLDAFVEAPDGAQNNMLVEYTRRAQGFEWAETPRIFKDLLPETLGILVMQEQVQRIYQTITDCSGPEAEKFRSNVGKKKKLEIDKAYPIFISKATEKYGEDDARKCWDAIQTFSSYGFCFSHSVGYSHMAYACSFLKYHYPLQWWCAVLSNASKNEVNENFWCHCGSLVDLPDIKYSSYNFKIVNDRIKAPLSLLNGIGETAHAQLCKYMPYIDIKDFCDKIQKHREDGAVVTESIVETINKKTKQIKYTKKVKIKHNYNALTHKVVYTLIISGVMDSLFEPNTSVIEKLAKYEEYLSLATNKKAEAVSEEYKKIGDLEKFQIRKEILPAYSASLLALLKLKPQFQNTASGLLYKNGNGQYKVLTNVQISSIMSKSLLTHAVTGAVPAYIISTRTFSYQSGSRTACSLTIDIEGERYEWVKWPDQNGDLDDRFNSKLDGSVAMLIVRKFKAEKPFAIEDIDVLSEKITIKKGD